MDRGAPDRERILVLSIRSARCSSDLRRACSGAIFSAIASAKTHGLPGDKSPVSIGNARLEPEAWTPAEVPKPAHVQELARRPIGLAEVPDDLPFEAHNLGHHRGELGNGEVLT